MSEFNGKRFVVTGAASGIGAATAAKLLDLGAEVHSLDRNVPTVPVTSHTEVDLANPNSIDAAIESLEGSFDGLMNIAGGSRHAARRTGVRSQFACRAPSLGGVLRPSQSGWQHHHRQFDRRLRLARTARADPRPAQHRHLRGGGLAWFKANPQEGNTYNFSKEVSTVYTMSMGLAVAEMGFRINAVLPGPVETPILTDFEESMGKDTLDGLKNLLGRHAEPGDIADTLVFLASDAARWVNGHALVVDGGVTGSVLSGVVPAPEI